MAREAEESLVDRLLPWMRSFRNKVVLVTGASSGIGKETAVAFGRQGARVALAARRRELLRQVAADVTAAGGRALVVPVDVTDARAVRAAVGRVRRAWDRLDVLVNNAGVLIPDTVQELAVADLEAMLRVNLYGALFMMQAALPLMARQGRGTIINVASLGGRRGITPIGGYCATKFALVGLTEALRTEVDGRKIHVGLVMPGVVETPMVHDANQEAISADWPEALNMPVSWVATAVLLAARFRLREIAVPPGAATLEIIGSLAPGAMDAVIGWMRAAGRQIRRMSE